MHRKSIVLLAVALLVFSTALSAQIRKEKPNDMTFELGGHCLIYSLNYQRLIHPAFGLEIGASYIGGGTSEGTAGVFFLSGGGRFYLINKNASPYLSGGIVYISAGTDSGPLDVTGSGVYFYASPGFELRMAGGFVFRAGVNFLIKNGFFVWPGLHLGIAF
ncbi:MAG TPA: hypothetical protein VLJ16_05795 [Acidobacteriota bacterium]|nr:hypothetical protein [Acidobacteriota bacterium]